MRASLLTLVLAALPVACGGPTVGEIISKQVTLTLTAVTSDPEVAAPGESAGGLGVRRLFLSTSSLALLPCRENTEALVLPARGYDLLAELTPHESVGTAVTELCGIRLDVDPVSQSALEGVPDGAALYAEGSDADDAQFAVSSDTSSSILLAAVGAESFGDLPLLLGVDVSVLLADVPLAEDMSVAAQKRLDGQTSAAFSLYVDANDNHALDEDENTPVATAAASD